MKIVVGLGNPGKKYEFTRHNAGFMVIDKLSFSDKFIGYPKGFRDKSQCRAQINKGHIGDDKVLLVKPQTYMNSSGDTVVSIMQDASEPVEDLLVVSDDYNLLLGTVRFRRSGASGGHNGLQSIIDRVGHNKFHRLRVGVGPIGNADAIGFVLERFNRSEEAGWQQSLGLAVEAVFFYIQNGIDKSMNKYN